MSFYDTPSRHVYSFAAVNLATPFNRTIVGPFNKRGRVISIAGQITTSTTGAQAVVTVTGTMPNVSPSPTTPNTNASPIELSYPIPVAAAPAGFSSDTVGASIQRDANNFLPITAANAALLLAITAAGAGVADLELVIDWF